MNIHIPYLRGEGCLNTFILFDLINNPALYTEIFIARALQALHAEGADDALILMPTDRNNVIIMHVLEPDGSFANFCGNGARVVAAYLIKQFGLPKRCLLSSVQ